MVKEDLPLNLGLCSSLWDFSKCLKRITVQKVQQNMFEIWNIHDLELMLTIIKRDIHSKETQGTNDHATSHSK